MPVDCLHGDGRDPAQPSSIHPDIGFLRATGGHRCGARLVLAVVRGMRALPKGLLVCHSP